MNIPLRNSEIKTYGSHNLIGKEGNSKFYQVEEGEAPQEFMEGKSKFYRNGDLTAATETAETSEERDGFKNIFGENLE